LPKIFTILFFLFAVAHSVAIANVTINKQQQTDSCCQIVSAFYPYFGLTDGSIATCQNVHLHKKSELTGGNECAYGKIIHSSDVTVDGNVNVVQEFVSGEGAWVSGNVVSGGSIKTKPKDWSQSIGGTAQDNCQITDANCEITVGKCIFDVNFVPIYNGATPEVYETYANNELSAYENIHVSNGKTYTWYPGNYGKVVFDYKSTIIVSPGVYNVTHLEIHKKVTFQFTDLSDGCDNTFVNFAAIRSIDIERNFQMTGINFGGDSDCSGTYGVLWTSCGDISIKSSKYPFYGAVVANKKN